MSRTRDGAAVAGAAVILLAAVWFDRSVLLDAQQQAARTFDSSWLSALLAVANVAIGAGCLAVGWLGYRAGLLVGVLYALVGGLFALLPWLFAGLGATVNGAPPVLPDPVISAVDWIFRHTVGLRDAVGIIGGAMLLTGVIAIVRSVRDRRFARGSAAVAPKASGA